MYKIIKLMLIPSVISLAFLPLVGVASINQSTLNAFKVPALNQLQMDPISNYKLAYCYTRYFCRRFCRPDSFYRVNYRCQRDGRVVFTPDYDYDYVGNLISRGFRCVKITAHYQEPGYHCWKRCFRRVMCY